MNKFAWLVVVKFMLWLPVDVHAFGVGKLDSALQSYGEVYGLIAKADQLARAGNIPTAKKILQDFLQIHNHRADLLVAYCDFLQTIQDFNELKVCVDQAFEKLKLITRRKTSSGKNLSGFSEYWSDSDIKSYERFITLTPANTPDPFLTGEVRSLVTSYISMGDIQGAVQVLRFAEGLSLSPKEKLDLYGFFFDFAFEYNQTSPVVAERWPSYERLWNQVTRGKHDYNSYRRLIAYSSLADNTVSIKSVIRDLEAIKEEEVVQLSIRHSISQDTPRSPHLGESFYEQQEKIHRLEGNQWKYDLLASAYSAIKVHDKAFQNSVKALAYAKDFDQASAVGQVADVGFSHAGLILRRTPRYAYLAGDLKAARAYYQEFFLEGKIFQDSHDNAELLGKLLTAEGKPLEAISHYKTAISTFELRRQHIASEAAKIQFSEGLQTLYDDLIQLLLKTGDQKSAFEYADRAKSRALLDLIRQRGLTEILASGDYPHSIKRLLEDLKVAEYQIRSAHLRGEAIVDSANLEAYRAVVRKIGEESPRVANLIDARYASVNEVQTALSPNTALVLYYGSPAHLSAFVLDKNSLRVVTLKPSSLALVEQYRTAIQNPTSQDTKRLGTALHASLIAPLGLKPGTELIVVPHGQLHYLPFGALEDKAGNPLAQTHTLRTLPAASLLLEKRAAKNIPLVDSQILLVGNPDLGERSYDLPGAEAEAKAISELFAGRSTVLLNRDAKKSAVLQHFKTKDILHFALHGIYEPADPLASGLALAADTPAPGLPLKGLLSVQELYGLQTDASLVVLSACDTGLGAIQSGDEVVGLNRALFFTGARNVISSLWAVDDEATTYLMTRFYKQLEQVPAPVALQRAKLETRKKYPAPYYWAAFVLAGG